MSTRANELDREPSTSDREPEGLTTAEATSRAEALIRKHGARTAQVLVDSIVNAVRDGDDGAVTEYDKVLRAVEAMLPGVSAS